LKRTLLAVDKSYYEVPAVVTAAVRRSGVAQSAEHSTVNRRVVGSSPTPGASRDARPARAFAVRGSNAGSKTAERQGCNRRVLTGGESALGSTQLEEIAISRVAAVRLASFKPSWGARKETTMAKVINCDCGFVVPGDSDEQLLAAADAHIRDAHPDMVGKVSKEDLLAQAREA
jgi:predicted small metal-binding protein